MDGKKLGFDGTCDSSPRPAAHGDRAADGLIWDVAAIGVFVTRFAELFGKRMGITGSQWLTLKAVAALAEGEGAAVRDVAALLCVNGSFISAQSKVLQQQGLLHRSKSTEDGRVMRLSLTDTARERLAEAESGRSTLDKLLRGDLDNRAVREVSETLKAMRKRIARAIRLVDASD